MVYNFQHLGTLSTQKPDKINFLVALVYFTRYIGTMSTQNEDKLNRLLAMHPPGTVLTSSWLVQQGYSLELQKRYRKSQWFSSIGTGAMVRTGDSVDYLGGIYALQKQLGLSVHPAAKTALSLHGKAHFLEMSQKKVRLFGGSEEAFPLWFKHYDWQVKLECSFSSFLPNDLGLTELEYKSFGIKVSTPARALMECLYLSPQSQPILEILHLMENLNNLRPKQVQELLENCSSIKVKRLFLYLAEKAAHSWFSYLNTDKINLGSGKRSLVKSGVYVPAYQITVPNEVAAA